MKDIIITYQIPLFVLAGVVGNAIVAAVGKSDTWWGRALSSFGTDLTKLRKVATLGSGPPSAPADPRATVRSEDP